MRFTAFGQLAAVREKLVEVNDGWRVLIEVVTLKPSHHDEDALGFHFKELSAGDAIKIERLFGRCFDQQSTREGKMCEELLQTGVSG
jgi:hypothetical protein